MTDRDETITIDGGRRLGYREYGSPDGAGEGHFIAYRHQEAVLRSVMG